MRSEENVTHKEKRKTSVLDAERYRGKKHLPYYAQNALMNSILTPKAKKDLNANNIINKLGATGCPSFVVVIPIKLAGQEHNKRYNGKRPNGAD